VFALAGVAFFILRWLLRRAPDPALRPDLDTYEIAWLKDGPRGVVRAALAALHGASSSTSTASGWRRRGPAPSPAPARNRAVRCWSGRVRRRSCRPTSSATSREVRRDRGAPGESAAGAVAGWEGVGRWIPLLGMLVLHLDGRRQAGDRAVARAPGGLLVCLLARQRGAASSCAAAAAAPDAAGDRRLKALAYRHAALRTTLTRRRRAARADDAGLAVALWGTAALSTWRFTSLDVHVRAAQGVRGEPGTGSSSSAGRAVRGGGGGGGGRAAAVAVVAAAGCGGGGGCGS
jgi:uncharacterized protein (TIGR04222 family)